MSERVIEPDYQEGGIKTYKGRDEAGRPEEYFDWHNPLQPGDGCPICVYGFMKRTDDGLQCDNCGRTAEAIQRGMGGEQWNPSH